MIFIGNSEDCLNLRRKYDFSFFSVEELDETFAEITERLKDGEDMIFASVKKIDLLKKFWIFSYEGEISESAVITAGLPQHFNDGIFYRGKARYLYYRAESSYAMHGIDEEPRAYVTPFVVNRNRYGEQLGAVGLWIKNYDKSLCGGNYKGGNWYVVAVDGLYRCMSQATVADIVGKAAEYCVNGCYISRLEPEFTCYRAGERVRVDYTVENTGKELRSAEVVIRCNGDKFIKRDVALNPDDTYRGHAYFYPAVGSVKICAELFLHDIKKYGVEREENRQFADRAESGFIVCGGDDEVPERTPEVGTADGRLTIDGETDFFAGTHYYPCSDFFELSYRNVDVLRAESTISAMEKEKIKICRIWCDPVLDEQSIRGMESVIRLLAGHGIVAWITFFTSWAHTMEIHTEQTDTVFEAADMKDEAFIGLIMNDIESQKEYVRVLVSRWKKYGNIVWDLTNEFSVVDPPDDRADFDWVDKSYRELVPPYNSIDLFRQWAEQIRSVITDEYGKCGAPCRPVVYGVSCWDTGSENYRCTNGADIIATHTYMDKAQTRYHANFQNSSCMDKPFVVEEFGGIWRDYREKAEEFHARFCTYLASGNDAAMSYEWGTSWVCDEISGVPPYMKFKDDVKNPEEHDGFLYLGRHTYAASWPSGSISLCPWIASHEYCINYPNVDFESPVMLMTRRFAEIGRGLGFRKPDYRTYLVLPFETYSFKPCLGYKRVLDTVCGAFDALWNAGAKFHVWQTDGIGSIPAGSVVIYPNSEPIPDCISRELDKLRERDVHVYCGGDCSFTEDPRLEKVAFRGNVQVQTRNTEQGELLVLHTDETETVHAEVSGVGIDIKNDGLLLFDGRGKLKAAEFCGRLEINGREILTSGDRVTAILNEAGNPEYGMRVMPFYPCLITLPEAVPYGISDGNAILETVLSDRHIAVNQDTVGYTFMI